MDKSTRLVKTAPQNRGEQDILGDMNPRGRYWIDLMLLCAMFIACASGLVLLFAFHVGSGCLRPECLGVSRLTWQNAHRLGAVLTLASLAVHVEANVQSVMGRLRRTLRGHFPQRNGRELLFYAVITIACVTGFWAWFVMPGSLPLFGPVHLAALPRGRHRWVDVHHITSLVSIYLTARHVRKRWPALSALSRLAGQATASPPRPLLRMAVTSAAHRTRDIP